MIEGWILPDTDDPDGAPFWAGCRAGELRIQACTACGRRRMPPRPRCPWCGSFETRWEAMAGTATVWSLAVPHPPLLGAYGAIAPYEVVVVTLDDDPTIRLVGPVVDASGAAPGTAAEHRVAIGDPVRVSFWTADEHTTLPCWIRTAGGAR